MAPYEIVLKFKAGQFPEDNQVVRDKLRKAGFNQQTLEIKLPDVTIKGEFPGTAQDFITAVNSIPKIGGIDSLELRYKQN